MFDCLFLGWFNSDDEKVGRRKTEVGRNRRKKQLESFN